nr:serine:threonine protein kinase ULK4 [Hymenolepis microstoma]
MRSTKISDIWGLGCILFRMFFGVTPFSSQLTSHLINMIASRDVEIPIQCTRKPSAELWLLLCGMLTKDPMKRIVLKDVANHRFWNLNSQSESGNRIAFSEDIPEPINKTKFTLKRSVSMGDNALAGAALLLNRTPNKNRQNFSATPKATSKERLTATNAPKTPLELPSMRNGHPVGDANFTLHAQACPVSLRPEIYDPRTPNGGSNLASTTTSSNDDISCRSNSNTFTSPVESNKRGFFESNDSLYAPLSPMPAEDRMTKSEYVFRNSDTSSRFGSSRIPQNSTVDANSSLVSPQTRARIALIYPWGDDNSNLPQESNLLASLISGDSNKIFVSNDLEEFNTSDSGVENSFLLKPPPTYVSQPLGDYKKWAQNPPKADLQSLFGIPVLSSSSIEVLNKEDITSYSSQLLNLLSDFSIFQDSKNRPSTFLSYVAWFLAVTTLESGKNDADKILRISNYLSAAFSLLKLESLSAIVKTWLCRIIGLLIYCSSILMQHGYSNPLLLSLISEIAPYLPTLMTTLVDILREPAFKGVFPLKQSGVATLGEIIICEMSICSRVLQDPMAFDDLNPLGFDVTKDQWQSAILRIIRSLSRVGTAPSSTQYSPRNYSSSASVKISDRGNSSTKSPATEDTVRLSAAKTLNEITVFVLGHKLMRILQHLDVQKLDRVHPGVQLALRLSSSLNSFFDCLLTPETVSRVWSDGIISCGGTTNGLPETRTLGSGTQLKNPLVQQVAYASCSALTGLIRLRPSLFMCGLVDRSGSTTFIQKLNPTISAKEGQTTAFMACLLSATATGLLLPLAFHNKPLGQSFLRIGMKSGTPAACRRFLNNSKFMASIMRQLESPHVMLRAKAYLLVSAALDSSSGCSDTLITACDARLPSCLERDLRMTNLHYTPQTTYDDDGVLILEEEHKDHKIASMPLGLQYLGICVKHLSDLLVDSLIPNICSQVAIAIGACVPQSGTRSKTVTTGTAKTLSKMTVSTYQDLPKRNISSAGGVHKTETGQIGRPYSTNSTPGISLKTCLPAYSCLPGILASCASIRNFLLLPPKHSNHAFKDDGFCLIQFLAKIIEHWASSTGIHHSGSAENHLLRVTLALAEDISRLLEVVENRRDDLIKALLPAIARLAVAPTSDSITRTICVKIILDMRNVWRDGCGDTDSMTSSNISLNYPESVSSRNLALARSPLSSDRLNAKPSSGLSAPLKRTTSGVSRTPSLRSGAHGGENKRPLSATGSSSSSVTPTPSSSSRVSSCRPNSFYGRSSSGVSSLKGYKYATNLANNLQGPSPDVLLAVVDIVNTLLIPYAPPLLDLRKASPAPFFLRLLLDCLKSSPPPFLDPSFFNPWRLVNLPHRLVSLLAKCNTESHRFSMHSLLTLNILSTLSTQCPQESGITQLLLQTSSDSAKPNILTVVYNVVVDIGSALIRRERCDSSGSSLIPSSNSNITSSRGFPSLFRVTNETAGVQHLFVSLELLIALLDLVTSVVRYALHCRHGKPIVDFVQQREGSQQYIFDILPNSHEGVCSVAERLLSSSQPPKHLPGILASILEVSFDSSGFLCEKKELELQGELESSLLPGNLVVLSLNALAGLSSLYGGVYCRTALSAAGLRGITMALQRNDKRNNTRLLLRILRRLCESDDVCLQRLTGPAAKPLISVISKLRYIEKGNAGRGDSESAHGTAQTTSLHSIYLTLHNNTPLISNFLSWLSKA